MRHRITPPKPQGQRLWPEPAVRATNVGVFYWHCPYCGCVSSADFINNMLAHEEWQNHRQHGCL
jgi:hypothetical protein